MEIFLNYKFFQIMHNFIPIVIPLIDNFGIFIALCCLMHSDFKRAILIIILEKKYSKLSTTYRLKLGCSLSGNQPTCSKIYMYGKIIYILPKFNAISMSNIQPYCCNILSIYGRQVSHSSEISGLCSMKYSSKNLRYDKPHIVIWCNFTFLTRTF